MTDTRDDGELDALSAQWQEKAVQLRLLAKGVPKLRSVNEAASEAYDECAHALSRALGRALKEQP